MESRSMLFLQQSLDSNRYSSMTRNTPSTFFSVHTSSKAIKRLPGLSLSLFCCGHSTKNDSRRCVTLSRNSNQCWHVTTCSQILKIESAIPSIGTSCSVCFFFNLESISRDCAGHQGVWNSLKNRHRIFLALPKPVFQFQTVCWSSFLTQTRTSQEKNSLFRIFDSSLFGFPNICKQLSTVINQRQLHSLTVSLFEGRFRSKCFQCSRGSYGSHYLPLFFHG